MQKLRNFKTKRALKKKVKEQDLLISHLKKRIANLETELDMEQSLAKYYKLKCASIEIGGNTYQEDIKEAV